MHSPYFLALWGYLISHVSANVLKSPTQQDGATKIITAEVTATCSDGFESCNAIPAAPADGDC